MIIRTLQVAGTLVASFVLSSLLRLNAEEWEAIDPAEFALAESEIAPGFGAKILFSKTIQKQRIVDTVVEDSSGSVITTARRRLIDGSGEAMSGWVFGYESVVKDEGLDPELDWRFQGNVPFLYSRFELSLPQTWTYSTHFFNGQKIEPTTVGGRIAWEARNQKALEVEPLGTVQFNGLSVALRSPSGERDPIPDTWEAFAAQLWPYYSGSKQVTAEMQRKVAEVTAGVDDVWEQARLLSEYVQSVNYLSISLDLGTGGGVKPRTPVEVFETNYGDCKDKTNLLTALLAERGIEAYPLIVSWGGPEYKVDRDWVSMSQFNHCITAIKVPDGFELPNSLRHDGLGDLMIFDPTNEYAVFGDLDDRLQGSYGILLAGDSGGLLELPTWPLDARTKRRKVQARIYPNGVEGHFTEMSEGQGAAEERLAAFTDKDDYKERVSRRLAESIASVRVGAIHHEDDRLADRFTLEAGFAAPGYGKNLRNVTLIFKPILIGRYEALPFGEDERTQPVHLSASRLLESYEIELPAGFELSEMPENRSLTEDFGSYELSFAHDMESRTLRVEREVRILPKEIPVERFPALEAFFKARIKADQSAVVIEAI